MVLHQDISLISLPFPFRTYETPLHSARFALDRSPISPNSIRELDGSDVCSRLQREIDEHVFILIECYLRHVCPGPSGLHFTLLICHDLLVAGVTCHLANNNSINSDLLS